MRPAVINASKRLTKEVIFAAAEFGRCFFTLKQIQFNWQSVLLPPIEERTN